MKRVWSMDVALEEVQWCSTIVIINSIVMKHVVVRSGV